jgi:DNA-binding CsgD family transcriptional regulator
MRQLGIRSIPAGPRTATRADPLGLTRREREVLELICAGHTNAEIAAKLFISPKTVDHHVSAVLAKLDAPTREVAATHAARLGLVTARELPARRGDASGVPRPRHLLTAVVIARPGGDGRHTRQQRVTAL